MEVVTRWWFALANAVGAFIEEAAFRVVLAFDVIVGRVPQRVEKRWWRRSAETPLLVDLFDWTDDRLIASILIWPPLESPPETADHDMRERAEEILDAIARGAAEKMWSTRWELDYGLQWDHRREVWIGGDGHHYDGARFHDYSRQGGEGVSVNERLPRN